MAGYSGTPLTRKLGIAEHAVVSLVNPPADFISTLGILPNGVELVESDQTADLVIVFDTDQATLRERFRAAMARIPADGAIWVGWPKRSSGVATDITEDRLREMFLPTGMVDNKVCAIDHIWSGLRFVVRKELRSAWGQQ